MNNLPRDYITLLNRKLEGELSKDQYDRALKELAAKYGPVDYDRKDVRLKDEPDRKTKSCGGDN